MLFGRSDTRSGLSVIINKLGEMSFLNELLNGNFKFEAIHDIITVVLVISAVLVSIPFLRGALQLAWLL